MRGIGTLINVACILLGGIAGCIAGNRLKENIRETLMTMTGIGVIVLGMGGAMAKMLSISDGNLVSGGTIMMIVSLAAGTLIGEILQIEDKIVKFGEWLKVKSHSTGDSAFVNGFVTASCTVCIGAMAVIGAIQDGISGDYSVLAAKGVIDAIIICIMAAAQGKGCIFSAIPVGIWQGTLTVAAMLAGDFLPVTALDNLSFVGSVLILCVGVNLVREKQIRVANVLPSILIAVIWGL
ncbi:MAG: DUF554 domain-containing protein [Lachnospiraceae bacterium]|nr:DUF554 domain-containing protein [Lachnospiraceae bacterium]